jgi:hypothetical protein
MTKYRKLPVEVDAFKWTADYEQTDDPIWIVEAIREGKVRFNPATSASEVQMVIETLEGNMIANVGDYVIRGTKGEIYPCKPDIFESIYEEVK